MHEKVLSDGEWRLMNLLWDSEPRTVGEMAKETGWTKSTVNVMMNRLVEKGAVRIESDGAKKLCYPAFGRESAVKQEAKSTLNKIRLDGVGLLISAMTEEMELSSSEIDELICILKGAKKK